MIISAEYRIAEIASTVYSNSPYRIRLEFSHAECFMTLDREDSDRLNIRLAFDLKGKILACAFESIDNPSDSKIESGSFAKDNLIICSLSTKIRDFPGKGYTVRPLKLATADLGNNNAMKASQCPFYQFTLNISAEEYAQCKALPKTAVFRASFKVQNARS
ncbi:MAG: hypothetical protein V1928_03995 [Parcubacteria group bacterium]